MKGPNATSKRMKQISIFALLLLFVERRCSTCSATHLHDYERRMRFVRTHQVEAAGKEKAYLLHHVDCSKLLSGVKAKAEVEGKQTL
jgi:hypothetical protein